MLEKPLILVTNDDGIDSKGFIAMSDGIMIIHGSPVAGAAGFEPAIDRSGTFNMTGGTLLGVGSSVMSQGPSDISTQYSVLINLNTTQTPRLLHLNTTFGEVFTFMPQREFKSIVYCSPQFAPGSYDLYLGGTCTGTSTDGLYEGGTYTPGTRYTSFTISEIATTIGEQFLGVINNK